MLKESDHIQRILAGDRDAFRYFVRTYQYFAFTLAFRIVRNKVEAEEVVQDSFLNAYKSLNQFKQAAKFSTWLYPIVVREAIKRTRKKKLPISDLEVSEMGKYIATEQDFSLEHQDQRKIIDTVLNRMKAKERLVLQLHYLDEKSIQEIQEITAFSISNIKVLLHRARKSFHNLLDIHQLNDEILN